MAIEMVDFPMKKWWFSIVMLVYQRVYERCRISQDVGDVQRSDDSLDGYTLQGHDLSWNGGSHFRGQISPDLTLSVGVETRRDKSTNKAWGNEHLLMTEGPSRGNIDCFHLPPLLEPSPTKVAESGRSASFVWPVAVSLRVSPKDEEKIKERERERCWASAWNHGHGIVLCKP